MVGYHVLCAQCDLDCEIKPQVDQPDGMLARARAIRDLHRRVSGHRVGVTRVETFEVVV